MHFFDPRNKDFLRLFLLREKRTTFQVGVYEPVEVPLELDLILQPHFSRCVVGSDFGVQVVEVPLDDFPVFVDLFVQVCYFFFKIAGFWDFDECRLVGFQNFKNL